MNLTDLLDLQQSQQLFQSLVAVDPYHLSIIDPTGMVLLEVSSPHLTDEKTQYLQAASRDQAQSEGADCELIRHPLEGQGQLLGEIVGGAVDTTTKDVARLRAIVQVVGQTLSDQLYKEYELDTMSQELLNRYEELTLLYELSEALGAVFDINAICEIALEMALEVLSAKRAFIALLDNRGSQLTIVSASGMDEFIGRQIPMGEGISGRVAARGQTILLDAQAALTQAGEITRLYPQAIMNQDHPASQATLSVPLILSTDDAKNYKGVLGVITLIGHASGRFSAGDAKLLNTLAVQIATAIHNSQLVTVLQEAERVQEQINIAAQIQQSLLPKESPQVPGIVLAGQCVPAANIGGDYYDFLTDEAQRLTLLIADASGHSIGSALMMVTARSQLRTEMTQGKSLGTILANTNRAIFEDLSHAEMFISLFCAQYDPRTRQLTFVNGGHNPPLLCRATTGEIIPLDGDGLILGVLEEVEFEEATITMDAGDLLILYTDGVVEARSPQGEQFGEARLHQFVQDKRSLSPTELIDLIYHTIGQYTENAPQQDDITLLVLKVS